MGNSTAILFTGAITLVGLGTRYFPAMFSTNGVAEQTVGSSETMDPNVITLMLEQGPIAIFAVFVYYALRLLIDVQSKTYLARVAEAEKTIKDGVKENTDKSLISLLRSVVKKLNKAEATIVALVKRNPNGETNETSKRTSGD